MKHVGFLALSVLLVSCQTILIPTQFGLAEAELRSAAYEHAVTWIGVPYVYGGQTRSGVDCSGLVVRAYQHAVREAGFGVPFHDAAVIDFRRRYTVTVQYPEKGDLIFMGDGEITHIALFEKIEDDTVFFVDAFEGEDAVSYRNYPINSPKIHYFGRLLVYKGE